MIDEKTIGAAKKRSGDLDPMIWLNESAAAARSHVYTEEVMKPINALKAGGELEPLKLSESYLKNAGELARKRAADAAYRLASILKSDL